MTDENAQPIFSEIASTGDGRDITRGWLTDDGRLPAQDPILTEFGGRHYDIYKQVLSDWQVRSTFGQRQLALTACEWEIEPGGSKRADKNAAALLEEQLKSVGWDDATQGMHFGVFYGFAVAECLYARDGSTVGLDRIKVRDRARFAYDAKMQLRLLTAKDSWKGELLPERKFWQFCTGADHDDDPYGMGLAHWLYWPVQFKRGNIKFWLIAAEKFGSPTAVGWFPPNTTPDDRAKLLAALKAIQTESGIRVPEGIRIELLEAQRASGLDYERLCIYLDQAIAKITLGQVMTSEAVGGQYKADVQNSVRQELIKADADLLCESFNRGPARWLTEWNYPGAASPRVFRLTEPEEDLNGRAERESKIFTMGYRPTLAQIEEVYGGEWEEVKKAEPDPTHPQDPTGADPSADPGQSDEEQTTGFAAPADAPADAPANPVGPMIERLGQEADPLLAALLAPIRALLEQSADLDAFQAGLLALYPDLDPSDFAALMGQALAVADASGRLESR
ncbi:MAG: DUF935 family protein [Candidatus Competibacter denitrificans]